MSIDRLTLDESTSNYTESSMLAGIPDEELLCLDDGTPLPAELTELRSLLQLHSAFAGDDAPPEPEPSDDDPDAASRLAEIASAKADMLRDCLLDFDEGMLLLHDKLLDHERLVKRLDALRRRQRAVPAGRLAYDEAVAFDADDDDDDDEIDLSDLLAADLPGGARSSGAKKAAAKSSSSGSGGAAAAAEDDDEPHVEEEDEETLDQRVSTSRQQIKAWVRALEEGKQPPNKANTSKPPPDSPTQAPSPPQGARPPQQPTRMPLLSKAAGIGGGAPPSIAGRAALPPVKPPPPKARETSYSMRLRANTATWRDR